jgi:hypothetical protein
MTPSAILPAPAGAARVEQYTALLTFFLTENDDFEAQPIAARLDCKVDNEVLATVTALCTLIASLDQITALAAPPDPDWTIEPQAV